MTDDKRFLTIGVLGGMGPQATVDFLGEVIARTPARRDQEHLRVLVDSNPGVPDRQAAIRGDDSAVRKALVDMATGLEAQGADFLVMPCNTAHAFIDDAAAAVAIPFISIIDVTIDAVQARVASAGRVALLATDACLSAGHYQRAAGRQGIDIVVPDADGQSECMALIAAVKAGNTGDEVRRRMYELAGRVAENPDGRPDAIIAGCTEIPLIIEGDVAGIPLISSTDELAQRAVDLGLRKRPLPTR